ncbi:thiamine-phosphate kinase [Pseudoglutamicibacter albus]|uniref:thiamine-phosphate kinase n=1 Tax=Pseudoglutamicibacter TaxID=1742991 RepID=UPI000C77BE6E|nr:MULTISPECIES: thiamine-phosphate kinase [Pseudoglutamicibacter]PKY81077.1 thiamine-phosphate kinase [Pseudoglutamicibacter albus]WIK84271.1 thiamine-phosphate kinase [Pseudoglutamicibacter albus]
MGTVSGMGERAIIASINQAFGSATATQATLSSSGSRRADGLGQALSRVVVANGDDAAVVVANARMVFTMDTSVEDQDFMRTWPSGARTSPRMLGYKCAVQNLSDINAMGARTRYLLVSLSFPGDIEETWPAEIAAGMRQACDELDAQGVELIGGDVSAAESVAVSITAIGELGFDATPLVRSAAQPGDEVYVAGRVPGTSGSALNELLSPRADANSASGSKHHRALAAHFMPAPPLAVGPALAEGEYRIASIDTSDGLVRDATRIAQASEVAVVLDEAAVNSFAAELAESWNLSEREARHNVLYGGEDFNLLFTLPAGAEAPLIEGVAICRIGLVEQLSASDGEIGTEPGAYIAGRRLDETLGFDHYSGV